MRTKILLVGVMVVAAAVVTGSAVGVEIGVGTEPSVSFAATWDLSPHLAVVTSFGAIFGHGVQTASSTLQTASYTVGVEVRYSVRFATSILRPYLAVGVYAYLGNGETSVKVSSSLGVQIQMLPNVYLYSEGAVLVPILDSSGWTWRLEIGVGFRVVRF